MLPSLYAPPFYEFDLRASHARTLLPAALASVPFAFVLVRVRVRRAPRGLNSGANRQKSVPLLSYSHWNFTGNGALEVTGVNGTGTDTKKSGKTKAHSHNLLSLSFISHP